jgi:hypothetical protein
MAAMSMKATPSEIASLHRLINGFKISRMLGLVANLGIADRIPVNKAMSAKSLAVESGVLADPLLRVCRALASVGIFTVQANNMIAHSRLSVLLRTDSNPSLHFAARLFMAPSEWGAWSALDDAMQGATPFEALWGVSRFDYLTAHAEEGRVFDAMMANSPDDRLNAVAIAYDFSAASLIIDVGGGNGALLHAILSRYPQPRGLIFDREDVVSAIPAEGTLSNRIGALAGDFFERAPPTADIYILSWILHDWADEQCLRILGNCRIAMRPGARLLVIERMLEPDPTNGDVMNYLADIQMMVDHGGRERTFTEFQMLLTSSGFGTVRPIRTASSVWIIESAAI